MCYDCFVLQKNLLYKATTKPLYNIEVSKVFNVFLDANASAVSGVITQTDLHGNELPIAFFSTKLNSTQSSWSTIEGESFAALVALQKYRNWLFVAQITL